MMKDTDDSYKEEYHYYDDDDEALDDLEDDIEQTRAEMSDTLHALENRFMPGQLLDQALGYFRGASDTSTDFATDLGRSIKSNPVPATLLGISLAWLMMGKTERPEHRYRRTYPTVPATPGSRESHGERKEQVRQAAYAARDRTKQVAHGAREKMTEASESVHHQASYWNDRAHAQAEQARRGLTYMWQEHPLVLGSIGIAVGAALGAGLPPTRREDALMGRKRDELLEHTEAMGKEQLHRAENVARAAEEAAREESRRQGLTPEAGREQLHETRQKAEHVAGAAQEAAKREAERQDLGRP